MSSNKPLGAQPDEATMALDTGALEPLAPVSADATVAEPPVVDAASTGGDGGGGGEIPPETPESDEDALNAKRMTLLEHLSELRVRLRNAAIAFFVSMIAAFFFVQNFFEWLTRPVRAGLRQVGLKEDLHVIGLTEPFWVFMKLAIVAGLIIASPFVFWELWKFVAPGLYKKEKKIAGLLTGATAACFFGGAVFGYAVLAEPATYYMMRLLKVPGMEIQQQLTMELVANFLMLTLAGCGAAFELPVVVSVLGWMGIVSAKGLLKFTKYALVLSAVAGAVLTPSTDPFTQILLAGPLFGLYQISIGIVWLIERARKKREAELEKEYAENANE